MAPLKTSTLLILAAFFISCSTRKYDLFEAIIIRLPASLIKDSKLDYVFVDNKRKVSLKFDMTKNGSYGELLPKIDFDFLYNQVLPDRIVVKNKETREISGLKIGIIEKSFQSTEIKTFFTVVNDEILTGELRGDIKDSEYLIGVFNDIVNSIKKK